VIRGRFEFITKAATGSELLRAQALLSRTEELFEQMMVLPFDDTAAAHFDRLRQMKGLGKLGRADLLIASIALSYQATLVTRYIRHFQPIPALKIVNWVD
jgi:tRNA(fMet)-specific endonuclease VapC